MTQSQSDRAKLGFIGLGVMGGPMCQNLAEGSRHGVIIHDASADASAAGLVDNARSGQVIVDCITIPVSVSQEIAFAAKGATYVDTPVAGTAQSVSDRKISVMVGADDAGFA
jgi:3-hydroxyisobutyrate dehydrogenase-like beta-hydroxyacid dehydrogenase